MILVPYSFAFKMYNIRFIFPFVILSTILFLQFYSPGVKHYIGKLQQYYQVNNSSQKDELREQSSLTENLVDISVLKMDIMDSEERTLSKY